jgi:hypothetical protein
MRANDRGDIVLGWLLKLVVSLAIVGLVAFEAGAVLVAHVSADGAASDAATEAAFVYARGNDATGAEDAAKTEAARSGATLVDFEIADDGHTVVVTVVKKAKTIVLQRIGATRSWTEARSTRRRAVITN